MLIPCLLLAFSCLARLNADGPALAQPLTVIWRYQTDQTTDLTPATDDRDIFVPLASGILVALSADTGKLQWKAEAGGEFSASPAADNRSVYVATRYSEPEQKHVHGTLRALSTSTGVTLWMRTLPTPISGALVVDGDALFAVSVDGHVYSFDKRTGLVLWSNEYAEEFSSRPTISGKLIYLGGQNGVARALDLKTGQLAWQYKAKTAIQGQIAVTASIAYFGSADGNVYAFSEIRRRLLWHRRTGAAVQSVANVGNGLLASSLDNFVYLLSLNKGSLIWRRQLPGRISSQPVTASDGALFTPFSTDAAIVLELHDGKLVNTLPLGEENSSSAAPIAIKNFVLITTPHALLTFGAAQK